jgi:hypothetical protein
METTQFSYFVKNNFRFLEQLKTYHFQPGGIIFHNLVGDLYDKVSELFDEITEVYIGNTGEMYNCYNDGIPIKDLTSNKYNDLLLELSNYEKLLVDFYDYCSPAETNILDTLFSVICRTRFLINCETQNDSIHKIG